jgi:signal transduction histidine kinase
VEYHAADLPELNARYKAVELALHEGQKPEAIMAEYDCTILMTGAEHYYDVIYNSIDAGDIILDYTQKEVLLGKIIFKRNDDSYQILKERFFSICMTIILSVLVIMNVTFLLLYLRIVRPFQKLQKFASNIAIGNLELPLDMQKDNYFGAFTESFDVMREELKKAREGEIAANRSKKELVASLSHDIKTPVSTIKALCEILEIKLADNEHIKKFITIHQKADMIDLLISNMFHSALADLEVLNIAPTEELSTIINDIFGDMEQVYPLEYQNELPGCLIQCDKLRLTQVIDNLLNNSRKYAGTEIHITYQETDTHLLVELRDFGTALEDLDLALVCEKFYRGSNSANKPGSGLGLYLAKQLMDGMGGDITCEKDHGFVVTISLRKVNQAMAKHPEN